MQTERAGRRLFILLAIGLFILLARFDTSVQHQPPCIYYYQPADPSALVCITQSEGQPVNNGYEPVAQVSTCEDTVPQLAVFFDQPMPINRADQATLSMLSGIGPGLAEKVTAFIREQGSITGLDALQLINGIGPVLSSRLEPQVCFQ